MFYYQQIFITITVLCTIKFSAQQQQMNSTYNNLLRDVLTDSFKFITLPQEQQQSTQNQLNYQQQYEFGQQLQQQQQQIPSTIQLQYENENSEQYLTQTNEYQQQPQQLQYYQQQQQHQHQHQQQQQEYLSTAQQQSNVYQFQSLPNTNSNQNTNNQQTNSNQNQNHIQIQQYLQVPSTVDGETSSHTNQQQFYYPLSYEAFVKSQQQQQQQQQQQSQQQQRQQRGQQYKQLNQQKIQRISPEYEYDSKSSTLPLSTGILVQPTSTDMSTALIRRLVPTQQQNQQKQQRHLQQPFQLSVQKQSQQIFSKSPKFNVDNNFPEFSPSYPLETNESTKDKQTSCTRCCQQNQNPCLECCSLQPYLGTGTLKLLAG